MFYERMFYEMSITDEKVLRLRNEKRLVEEDGDLETEVKGRLIGGGSLTNQASAFRLWPMSTQKWIHVIFTLTVV